MLFTEQMQTRAGITPTALTRRPGIHPYISMDIYDDINAATLFTEELYTDSL